MIKPRTVYTATLSEHSLTLPQGFTGTVQARTEVAIAFQVSGRILKRHVDSGQVVEIGELLFSLDPKKFEQNLEAAKAQLTAAEAELMFAEANLTRDSTLAEQNSISRRVFEASLLSKRAAQAQKQAAQAKLRQAEIALDHTSLTATRPGIMVNVTAVPDQVVTMGQSLGILADTRELEVEVFLPRSAYPPSEALAHIDDVLIPLKLREIAGAANERSRTWRARYQVESSASELKLGSLVRVSVAIADSPTKVFSVPLTALDERGDGAQIWQIVDQQAQPQSVAVLSVTPVSAQIQGQGLKTGDRVIALGTHLLVPGMPVKEYAQ
ncbi:efflux RND transporter periplasmic adaptor subunit [Spongiibacter sp. KMU-158]|uniref:Efflux RND transporter periplasmic adaptor subunit n=1 Tax=Spongiibacter pelagi TaxID=2760804 RepID=A0A927C557_9GAMM|nr:efflux RND transporter periplasmic adaptor subunit [Spongiibacter pelagi]MBD2860197.1 efflux RND transporter periplasmic adaptor subunit [Spongiibacter pelagi]